MTSPFIGEIRMFGGNFAPLSWAFCNGQLVPISENETLFNLIGTTYGGDGQSTFGLPNLQSRIPMHMGTNAGTTYVIGQIAGEEQVSLTTSQLHSHSHIPTANSTGSSDAAINNLWANSTAKAYSAAAPNTAMNAAAVQNTGGNQPHDNMVPYLVVSFIISLFGIFPTPN